MRITMSPTEHYFENLLIFGHDVKGDPNKNTLSKEIQETVESCADYIRFDKFYGSTILEYINTEIEEEKISYSNNDVVHGLDIALKIIEKYKTESEDKYNEKNSDNV